MLDLPADTDEQAVVAGAALGYGAVPPEAAERGVRLLGDAMIARSGG